MQHACNAHGSKTILCSTVYVYEGFAIAAGLNRPNRSWSLWWRWKLTQTLVPSYGPTFKPALTRAAAIPVALLPAQAREQGHGAPLTLGGASDACAAKGRKGLV